MQYKRSEAFGSTKIHTNMYGHFEVKITMKRTCK